MQLPIAFPIIKSECPFIQDVIVIKISGKEVPIATIVSPISISESPNFLAMLVADFTKKSAPFTRKIKPIIIKSISCNKLFSPLFFIIYIKLLSKSI